MISDLFLFGLRFSRLKHQESCCKKKLKVVVTGANGRIGTVLCRAWKHRYDLKPLYGDKGTPLFCFVVVITFYAS